MHPCWAHYNKKLPVREFFYVQHRMNEDGADRGQTSEGRQDRPLRGGWGGTIGWLAVWLLDDRCEQALRADSVSFHQLTPAPWAAPARLRWESVSLIFRSLALTTKSVRLLPRGRGLGLSQFHVLGIESLGPHLRRSRFLPQSQPRPRSHLRRHHHS